MCRTVWFLVTLALGLLVAPLGVEALSAGTVPRLGLLSASPQPTAPDWQQRAPFLGALRELGWVDGHNLALEFRWADGRVEVLPALAAELVQRRVDLIVAFGPHASAAAKQATAAIPIVMAAAIDPIGTGLAASLAQPGGNVTGTALDLPEIAGKLLQLLIEAIPQARRIAVLWNPTAPGISAYALESVVAGRELGVTFHSVEVREPRDLDTALAMLGKDRPDGLYVVVDPIMTSHRAQILHFAAQHGVPAIYTARAFVEVGGLMAYGPSLSALYARTATYVDKILKGAKPADLPIERPMHWELVINLKTAQALGLTLPPSLLFQADEVIR
jgi:putative ABC transport system substrate-binding protein